MNRTSLVGAALGAVSVTLLGAELLVALVLSDAVALGLCADAGLGGTVAAGDRGCGAGADARLVAACALGAVAGATVAIAGALGRPADR